MTADPSPVDTAICSLCTWSATWPTRELAGCAATWHVYESHQVEWQSLFGYRAPRDPDPRAMS